MFTDPTGFFWKELFGFIGAVIGIVATGGAAAPAILAGAIIGGAIGGAIGGTIDAALAGNVIL